MLNHRPASRPGDDIVIWSLLISDNTVYHTAEDLWKSMQGPILQKSTENGQIVSNGLSIRTGYLVSTAPRLNVPYLHWAPSTPTFISSVQSISPSLSGDDGADYGRVTPDGLVADWWLWKFDNMETGSSLDRRRFRNLTFIRERYWQGYRWGAVLCPIYEPTYNGGSNDDGRWWQEVGGRARRTSVVVCGTNDAKGTVTEAYVCKDDRSGPPWIRWEKNIEAKGWEWRGVYQWDDVEPLPEWRKVFKFLIV
ncbi:MAG: hypothetical protein LQ340_000843 [Diploschistes diacapsis]|nr:MAG: hypothetical protein LQ340_000843 [Diploschistes diacapsis]